MNKTEEINALNKRLAELLGYRLGDTMYGLYPLPARLNPYGGPVWYTWWDGDKKVCRTKDDLQWSTDMTQAMELLIEYTLVLDPINFTSNGTGGFDVHEWVALNIFKQVESEGRGSTPMEAITRAVIKLLEASHD